MNDRQQPMISHTCVYQWRQASTSSHQPAHSHSAPTHTMTRPLNRH